MKKLFLISMAATAMLAGCSNDETLDVAQNNNAIDFASFVDKSTKATDTDINNLGSIEVYGWRGDTKIFDAQQVTVNTSGEGTYTPQQYWEPSYTYAFEAIAPKDGEKGVSFAENKNGGTITFTSNSETDLLYAGVVTKTTGTTITANPGTVAFTFNHLLSRVKFTFKNTFPSAAAAKISVTNVSIENAYQSGSITPTASNAAWNVTGDNNNTLKVSFASTSVTDLVAGTGEASTDHMYLIPVSSPSYTVKFTVTLDQNGATSDYEHTATITTGMEMGKSYNFVASLNQNNVTPNPLFPIEFSATVTGWEDFSNTDITSTPSTSDSASE